MVALLRSLEISGSRDRLNEYDYFPFSRASSARADGVIGIVVYDYISGVQHWLCSIGFVNRYVRR